MKTIKYISKTLLATILINNLFIYSNASTLSSDTRYETFKGSSIVVPDVMEEGLVDAEIEGNTLLNLIKNSDYSLVKSSYDSSDNLITSDNLIVETSERYLKATTNNEVLDNVPAWMYTKLGNINLNMLKPNTQYTVTGDIIKGITVICIMNGNATKVLAEYSKVSNNKALLTTKDFNKDDISSQIIYGYTNNYKNQPIDIEVKNIMLFEGDLTEVDDIRFFNGLKSVGQVDNGKHKIDTLSFNNGNLIKGTTFTNGSYIMRENGKPRELKGFSHTDYIDVLPNKIIHVYNTNLNCAFYDKNKNFLGQVLPIRRSDCLAGVDSSFSVLTPENAKYAIFSVPIENQSVAKASYIKDGTSNEAIKFNKKEILLNEPLRSLPNGTKDKILKRNGQWVVERNCVEVVFDGSEKWGYNSFNANLDLHGYYLIPSNKKAWGGILSDKLNVLTEDEWLDSLKIGILNGSTGIGIVSESSSIGDFKKWLSKNPIKVVYELETPVYEPLGIESRVNLYTEITHIFNNSSVPANMKIVVDRTINKATEAVELAKTVPTIENLSRARMWLNLVKECSLKDQLQEEVNNIVNIEDTQLSRKTALNNLDIYIKSENMLSVSLNTNSITFDNYSGVEDVEKLNAIGITISSSLPYSLNVYMPTEITNANNSETLPIETLNIKESSKVMYQKFNDTTNKIVLKDDCGDGNGMLHKIDLKISTNLAHQADVYKTVLKFEVQQK